MRRRYNIFISSTFKDLDAERDVIKYDVISLLNNKYLNRGIEFHVVDLRFGINTEDMTEEESQNTVLNVCLSMIDSSRPFFISLLGNRYGWIPDDDRMTAVLSRLSEEKRRLVVDGKGCSVTELEILYGALGSNGENIDRCLFFIRDQKSYNGMSEKQTDLFNDGHTDKLESLKTRVHDMLKSKGKQNAYIPYELSWDSENKAFSKLETFRELVFKYLCDEIDSEIEELSKPINWYEYARNMTDFRIHQNCDGSVELYDLQSIKNESRLLISGSTGSGKSVLLSQLFLSFKNCTNIYPLISMIGVAPEVTSLNNILYLWVNELEENLSLDCTSDVVLNEKNPYKKLYDRFNELIGVYEDKGIHIVCLLDGLSSIAKTELGMVDFMWLSSHVDLICTCDSNSAICDRVRKAVNHELTLDTLRFDIKKLVSSNESFYGIMLPDYLKKMMEKDGVSPMYVKLFMIMVSKLTTTDFNAIRSASTGSDIEKINTYIVNLYKSLPKDLISAFCSVVTFISDRMSVPWLNDAVVYIASSRTGLRESDLEHLFNTCWDGLKFKVFMNIFEGIFSLDHITKQWTFNNDYLCKAMASKTYAKKLCKLVASYPDHDSMKKSYIAYYSTLASDSCVAERYLCTDEAYDSDRAKGYWASESISRICNETDHINLVSELIASLSDVSKIRYLYALINSLSIYLRKEWYITFAQKFAGLLDSAREPKDIYALAGILNSAAIYFKLDREYKRHYERVIDAACAAYKKCYEMDHKYADVRNMYKVALTNHADILCEKGDFDAALAIFQSLDKI